MLVDGYNGKLLLLGVMVFWYFLSFLYKKIPKMAFRTPVIKNSCGRLSSKIVKMMIENTAEPTMKMALKMLFAPTTRERWLTGA